MEIKVLSLIMNPYILLITVTLPFLSVHQSAAQNRPKPGFLLVDEELLSRSGKLNQQGDAAMAGKVRSIIRQADKELISAPYSVTFNKTKMAPTNDKKDYVSQAPYWWPDSSKADGKPYIRKDGKRNPEIYLLNDRKQLGDLSTAVKGLGFAYYYTKNEKYALKAKLLLETWFINPDTRMNPNLTYGQYIPGLNDGRGIGIIETRGLTDIPDAIALLHGSKSIDDQVINGVKKWYRDYSNWLLTSENGKSERLEKNNHGTNYDLQLVDFALFTGDKALATKVIREFTFPRIDVQFTTDGAQPLELARTKSWDYTNMNLDAWCKLAILSDRLGIDLWNAGSSDGKGIKAAVKWLVPYASGQKEWKHEQIGAFEYGDLNFILRKAKTKYPDVSFKEAFEKHPLEAEIE